MSNNPNKNIINFIVTAPSLSQPLVSQFEAHGDIIVDISKPPLNPSSSPPTQLTNIPGNIAIQNMYPSGSKFTQITGSPTIDSTQSHQLIILYDQNNRVLDNNINNYPSITRIKAYFSGQNTSAPSIIYTPSKTITNTNTKNTPSSDYTLIYVGVGIVAFFILGGSISFSLYSAKNNISGGGNRYINYGE